MTSDLLVVGAIVAVALLLALIPGHAPPASWRDVWRALFPRGRR